MKMFILLKAPDIFACIILSTIKQIRCKVSQDLYIYIYD